MLNHPGSINTVEWTIRERERELAAPNRKYRREWQRRGNSSRVIALFGRSAAPTPTRPQSPSPTRL
jgi:hypothetical protein